MKTVANGRKYITMHHRIVQTLLYTEIHIHILVMGWKINIQKNSSGIVYIFMLLFHVVMFE